ncbi:MAG: S41 family peptidase [Adhaeribacter sp.]
MQNSMNRLALTIFFCFQLLTGYGQANTCNCSHNLNTTIQKTEENYAGYPTKVNAKTTKDYNFLVQKLKQKAAGINEPKKCYYLIRDYIKFYEDKHFILSYRNENDYDSLVIDYADSYFQDKKIKNKLAPVEGIYTNPDSTITIGIKKTKAGIFQAFKIASKHDNFPKGFVYFTLTPNGRKYIVKDYNSFVSTNFPANQNGNLLYLWNYAIWGKISPQQMTAAESQELSQWQNNNNGLAFRKINADYSYLKIPTFINNDDKIQRLVSDNDELIRNTKYLIVDLRGNGGGNTGWIHFISYFMTNPIIQESTYLRLTPENIKHKLNDIAPFATQPIPAEMQKYFPADILNAYKKAYQEMPAARESFYPVPSVNFPLDSITRQPEKIALIVDDFCGSSAEYFFYLSKQSRKTISYGTNTLGMMDYEGMSTPTALPYEKFSLTIPISKSSWTDKNPIDRTGFKPDIVINKPQNEWLDFIIKDLPKR